MRNFVFAGAALLSIVAARANAGDAIYAYAYIDAAHHFIGIKKLDTADSSVQVVTSYVPYVASAQAKSEFVFWDGAGPAYFFDWDTNQFTISKANDGDTGYQALGVFPMAAGVSDYRPPIVQVSSTELIILNYVYNITNNMLTPVALGTYPPETNERGTRNMLGSLTAAGSTTLGRANMDSGASEAISAYPSAAGLRVVGSGGNGFVYADHYDMFSDFTTELWNTATNPITVFSTVPAQGYLSYSAAGEFMISVDKGNLTPASDPLETAVVRYSNTTGNATGSFTIPGMKRPWISQLPSSAVFMALSTGTVDGEGAVSDNYLAAVVDDQNVVTQKQFHVQTSSSGALLRGVGPALAYGSLLVSGDGTKLYDLARDANYFISIDIATGDRTRYDVTGFDALVSHQSTVDYKPAIGPSVILTAGPSTRAFLDYLVGKEQVRHGSEASLDKNEDLGLDAGDLQVKENEK